MTGDRAGQALLLTLILILPLSALIARRLPLPQLAKMAAGWIAIFGVLFVLVRWITG